VLRVNEDLNCLMMMMSSVKYLVTPIRNMLSRYTVYRIIVHEIITFSWPVRAISGNIRLNLRQFVSLRI
jgi:hypothetical protein